MPAADTTIDAARIQRAAIAGKTPSERGAMALEMSELVRQLVVEGIRRRQPDISEDELSLRLIERLHGKEVASAVEAFVASRPPTYIGGQSNSE